MDHFIRRIQHYADIKSHELDPLLGLRHSRQSYTSGQTIIALNEPVTTLYILESGWLMRSCHLDDGRRQIINFQLPGDYFDLMSIVGARSDHSLVAATDITLRAFDGRTFLKAIQESPKLASAFWWVTVQEETILRQQIVRIGRMSAKERVANFILELKRRQTIADGERTRFVPLPVPQAFLADALGLSIVHISRTLTTLKGEGLLKTSRQGIEILSFDKLVELAEYDNTLFEAQPVALAAQ